MENIRQISFNIYASSDDEAERGRKAIITFINTIGQHGAMVTGDKLHEAVSHLPRSPFVFNQIVKFFKR